MNLRLRVRGCMFVLLQPETWDGLIRWKRSDSPAASTAVEIHRTVLCLVAAVSDLRGALEVGLLSLAERAGVDLRGQRDGRGGQDQRGDKGLGEHGASPLVLVRACSDSQAPCSGQYPARHQDRA